MHILFFSGDRHCWRNSDIRCRKDSHSFEDARRNMGVPETTQALFSETLALSQGLPARPPQLSGDTLYFLWLRCQLLTARSLFEVEFHLCFDEWIYLNEQNTMSPLKIKCLDSSSVARDQGPYQQRCSVSSNYGCFNADRWFKSITTL